MNHPVKINLNYSFRFKNTASANLKITQVFGIMFLLDKTMLNLPLSLSSDFPRQCGLWSGLESHQETRRKTGIDFRRSTHGQRHFHSGDKWMVSKLGSYYKNYCWCSEQAESKISLLESLVSGQGKDCRVCIFKNKTQVSFLNVGIGRPLIQGDKNTNFSESIGKLVVITVKWHRFCTDNKIYKKLSMCGLEEEILGRQLYSPVKIALASCILFKI